MNIIFLFLRIIASFGEMNNIYIFNNNSMYVFLAILLFSLKPVESLKTANLNTLMNKY